ncbi:MAG: DnaD domain protein [Ruminococcaceae bacterium]|nr:DnaD domain protein [Oscillospiraceae bacterium]
MRADCAVTPQQLMSRLHFSELRLRAAETVLQNLGLIERAAEAPQPEERSQERVEFTAEDLGRILAEEDFRMLVEQTERVLGKKLTTNDLKYLANLNREVGLPADVIYLLVSHCIQRAERRYGVGRRPVLRQIEKEGYYWAKLGLFDQESAARYLKTYSDRQEQMVQYMQALQLGDRRPVDSEERYIRSWMEQGFPAETVALAYDRTVLQKHELNWRYLNGILRRWDQEGWHTAEQVRQGEERRPDRHTAQQSEKKRAAVEKYLKW